VKAAYLYRFAGYVNWPADAQSSGPFVIAVLGAPQIALELRRLAVTHKVDGHVIEVHEVRTAREVGRPAMLYLAPGHAERLPIVEPALSGVSILVVTDEDDGLDRGAVLNFVTLDHRVRFEVLLPAAERAHLKVSADLLAVAVRVRGGGRQSRDGCPPAEFFDDTGCLIRDAVASPPQIRLSTGSAAGMIDAARSRGR
jgi:hypothetical protein